MNSSFLGVRSESFFETPLDVSRIECLAMVESRLCNNEPMECSENGCVYRNLPNGDYTWFKDIRLTTTNCKFHRRSVIGHTNTSQIFSNALNSCTPPDLQCQLSSSIVVWNSSIVNNFLFSYVFSGSNFTWSGDYIYSIKYKYLFQILNSVEEDGLDLYKTTEGLYLFIIDRNLSESMFRERYYHYSIRVNLQHDRGLYELQRSENDFEFLSLENEITKKFYEEFVKDCTNQLNHLSLLAKLENRFHNIYDTKGNLVVLYSKLGMLFIPNCVTYTQITLTEKPDCFKFSPVFVEDDRNRTFSLFLTTDGFLVDFSPKVECSTVNTRQMVNSTHFLVRVGKELKLQKVADLKFVDFTSQNYDFDRLNFYHNKDIVDGFDLIDSFHGSPHSVTDDIEDKFHVLPNDYVEQETSFSYEEIVAKVKTAIVRKWQSAVNFVKSILIIIALAFILFIVIKLILSFYGAKVLKGIRY